jgi:hypothetical protein
MKNAGLGMILLAIICGAQMAGGCDKTVSEERTVEKKPDGTVIKEQEKTTRSPDGTVTETTEKKVSP